MTNLADTMPFSKLLGLEILEATPKRVTARLIVRADLCTSGGILHGGAAMAMADAMGAVASFLNLAPGARTTTLESKTNFLGAATEGSTVLGETTPIHIGRATSVWQTRITREDGKPVALVIQTQMTLTA
jgi:1,4-dihydroxy-2-naphthoyl-CoA hydrolase